MKPALLQQPSVQRPVRISRHALNGGQNGRASADPLTPPLHRRCHALELPLQAGLDLLLHPRKVRQWKPQGRHHRRRQLRRSMVDSDPANLRLSAGVELTNWLISNKEATASIKADLVTVINFADTPTLDYPLGDPGNADGAFNGIGADGGTFIAGGVQMAIDQILGGPAPTAQRSGIVVFTDGEVSRERLRRISLV